MGKMWTNVVPVWVFTAAGVVLVGTGVSDERRLTAMVAVLAASVLVAFILQVFAYRQGGLVKRLSWATAGSVALTAAGAVLFQIQNVIE
jgi:hypothetical protein